jgi:hypothetical protein
MSNNRSGISGDSEHSFILSKKLRPASPPLFQKATLPAFICFGQFHIVDAILRIFYTIHIGCCSKTQQLSKHFHNVYLNESQVSKLLIKPKH